MHERGWWDFTKEQTEKQVSTNVNRLEKGPRLGPSSHTVVWLIVTSNFSSRVPYTLASSMGTRKPHGTKIYIIQTILIHIK